jgi:hypothetical protein
VSALEILTPSRLKNGKPQHCVYDDPCGRSATRRLVLMGRFDMALRLCPDHARELERVYREAAGERA